MKRIYLMCFVALVFSCANGVSTSRYEKDESFCMSAQEMAFLGYDLDKVYDCSINIKVKANNDEEMDAFVASLKDFNVVEKTRMEGFEKGQMFLTVKVHGDYPKTLKKIRELSSVFYAEPDYKVDIIGTYVAKPSDDIIHPFGLAEGNLDQDHVGDMKEYALSITEALRAYEELGYGDHTVWAGIIDTGTNTKHEDLKGKDGKTIVEILKTAFGGYGNQIVDDRTGNTDVGNGAGHGTHCTGSICAVGNNNKGIAGVAWKNVKLASYKALHEGSGSIQSIYGSLRDMVDSVRRKVSQDVQATIPVNMSLGGPNASYEALESLEYARSKGFLIVAASGNDGQFLPSYPAGYPGVLTVGASGDDDKKTGFSTAGSWLNVVAPGLNIISLSHSSANNQYIYLSGTSMATPFVTGMITYLLSLNPTLTPSQIVAILEKTADKIDAHNQDPVGKYDENGFSNWYGYGRVNVYKAAKMIVDGNVPEVGTEYVETALIVEGRQRGQMVFVYSKDIKALVTMSILSGYSTPKTEIRGLRPGTYNVVCNSIVQEITIDNTKDVTVIF